MSDYEGMMESDRSDRKKKPSASDSTKNIKKKGSRENQQKKVVVTKTRCGSDSEEQHTKEVYSTSKFTHEEHSFCHCGTDKYVLYYLSAVTEIFFLKQRIV